MSGWYRMHRGWQDNPLFARDEFSKRDAWVWMIERAAWKETRAKAGGSIVTLERGQFTASIRFMAEAWGWHRAKVERFLGALKTETMIETRSETGQIVISICNYEEYQAGEDGAETPSETAAETPARHERDTSETNIKKDKNLRREETTGKPPAKKVAVQFELPGHIPSKEWEAFVAMRKKIGKAITDHGMELAVAKLDELAALGHPPAKVLDQSTFNNWQGLFAIKPEQSAIAFTGGAGRSGEREPNFAAIAGRYAGRGAPQ